MFLWRKEMLWVSLFVFLVLFDGWLRFFYLERGVWICNRGVFWGIAIPNVLLWGCIVLILVGCLWLLNRFQGSVIQLAITAVIFGGALNALDRLFYGCVLDYLSWSFGFLTFLPNFNIADSLIFLGIGGLIFLLMKGSSKL